MAERFQSVMAYLILILTCMAGIAHLSWWAACAGACALVLLSLFSRQLKSAPIAAHADHPSDMTLALSSCLNGSAAGFAAYMLGHGSAWLWGF